MFNQSLFPSFGPLEVMAKQRSVVVTPIKQLRGTGNYETRSASQCEEINQQRLACNTLSKPATETANNQ